MNRYVFLLLLVLGFLSSCQDPQDKEPQKPNILFLFADDQRAGTIHALGNDEIITPNIDLLAQSGISMSNTYIMGGSSAAVCSPSRAMMMTGRHLYGIEKRGWESPILENTISMPEVFKNSGYETFGTGKQHNGKAVFARGFAAGEEIMFGGMSDHWNVPVYHFDSTGKYDKGAPYIKQPGENNIVAFRTNCDHIHQGKHSSELFAEAAIDFIEQHDASKPFFAYVSFTAPHDPRSMPEEYLQLYDTASIAIPSNFLPEHPWDFGEFLIRDEVLVGFPRTKSDVKVHLRDYYAMISHMDDQIGRIIQALKESGDFENTIIVFTADNGLALGQHGMFGKQNLYEHSIHIPFVITGKGIPENMRNEGLCYLYDVFPTLCEIVDIEVPVTVQGQSFLACLTNESETHRDQMFYAYKEFMRSYRKEGYKLIEYYVDGDRHSQFFNLEEDALEESNLLDHEQSLERYQILKREMIEYMVEVGDTSTMFKELNK